MHTPGRARTALTAVAAVGVSLLTVLAGPPSVAHEGHDHDEPAGSTSTSSSADTAGASQARAASKLDAGFSDVTAIGDITEPISVDFAKDGTAFIALKTGTVKSFDWTGTAFEPSASSSDVVTKPLNDEVNNYWDRGLTGIAVDPAFPTRPYVYLNYTYNKRPGSTQVPAYGDPSSQYDDCATPASTKVGVPGGCIVMDRVTRITVEKGSLGWVMRPNSEKELFASGCFHFPSHASGDVTFGPDGKLYASMGDGASFDTEDYGQYNNNPCGDPADEGGALRAQDVRTTGDPFGFNGSVFRVDPDSGGATLLAYGHRNPWRLAFRPGTTELWNAEVGASGWEEINRLQGATSTSLQPVNRGWPCYEGGPSGSLRNNAWDLLDKPLCESLYAQGPSAVQAPAYSYQTRLNIGPLTPGEDCETTTSSISGVAFTPAGNDYPASYQGSVFFSDFARQCIWRLRLDGSGQPDPGSIAVVAQRSGTPVDLTVGPGGDLYYVDYGIVDGNIEEGAGGIHRLVYTPGTPTAAITTDRTDVLENQTVRFDATRSSDPQGQALRYAWDFDGNGTTDSTAATVSRAFATRGVYRVTLRVTDPDGNTATDTVRISVGTKPAVTLTAPSAALRWVVGQKVDFGADAKDWTGATLPADAFTWRLQIRHCPGACHTHPLQTFQEVKSGSFETPEHEYPSHLVLTLEVRDRDGLTTEVPIRLDPATVDLTFASNPAGLPVAVAGVSGVTTQTFIVGSAFTLSAPTAQTRGLFRYAFSGWSDGGAATHQVVAPATPRTYTASYTAATSTLGIVTKPKKLKVRVDGSQVKTTWQATLPVGTVVEVSAPKRQKKRGVVWVFKKWTDGGARTHTVTVTDAPTALKAVYKRVQKKR